MPISLRKRCRTKNKVNLTEKIDIVHQVLCKLKPIKQVAKEYRVTASWVSAIVQKVKFQPKVLEELMAEQDRKTEYDGQVGEAIADMYKSKVYFSSVKYIQELLKEDYNLEVKPWRLMHLMHHNLGMRYKKVKGVSW